MIICLAKYVGNTFILWERFIGQCTASNSWGTQVPKKEEEGRPGRAIEKGKKNMWEFKLLTLDSLKFTQKKLKTLL